MFPSDPKKFVVHLGRKRMNNIQLEEIIKAILARQYSWACVLMLRYNGYDPLHYIPYRTYIRLLKKNYLIEQESLNGSDKEKMELINFKTSQLPFTEQKQVVNKKSCSSSIPVVSTSGVR